MFLEAVRRGLAVLIPVECAGCGVEGRRLCEACAARLVPLVTPRTLSGRTVYTGVRYEDIVRRIYTGGASSELARPRAGVSGG